MPKWNCSVLERLCKDIELTKDGRLLWHGRWRKPMSNNGSSSLRRFPYAEFSYDKGTVLGVVRYLFFQLHDDRHVPNGGFLQAYQHRLKLAYSIPPPPEDQNQLTILMRMSTAEVPLVIIDKPPLRPNLTLSVITEVSDDYRRIPIELPQVVGPDRIRLVLHYLNGGQDQDAPIATTTKQSASVRRGIINRGTGSTTMRLRNITPYHPDKALSPANLTTSDEMVEVILKDFGVRKLFQGLRPRLSGLRKVDITNLGFSIEEADKILSTFVREDFLDVVYVGKSRSYKVTPKGIKLLRRMSKDDQETRTDGFHVLYPNGRK